MAFPISLTLLLLLRYFFASFLFFNPSGIISEKANRPGNMLIICLSVLQPLQMLMHINHLKSQQHGIRHTL